MSHLFSAAGANYIPVSNLQAAVAWYAEKLGLRKVEIQMDDGEDCVALGFSKDDYAFCLGPIGGSSGEMTPMLNSSSLKKAREFLISRGVNVTDILQDRQGTHYFEMRDLDNNLIEITEEH